MSKKRGSGKRRSGNPAIRALGYTTDTAGTAPIHTDLSHIDNDGSEEQWSVPASYAEYREYAQQDYTIQMMRREDLSYEEILFVYSIKDADLPTDAAGLRALVDNFDPSEWADHLHEALAPTAYFDLLDPPTAWIGLAPSDKLAVVAKQVRGWRDTIRKNTPNVTKAPNEGGYENMIVFE